MTKPPLGKIWIFKESLEELARVVAVGERKHGALTWLQYFADDPESCIDSITRHLAAYASGEFRDEEDGFVHMAAIAFRALALCKIGLLMEALENGQDNKGEADILGDSVFAATGRTPDDYARQGWDGYPA